MALKVNIFLSSSGKSSNARNGSAAPLSIPSCTSGKSLLSSASSSMASSSESSEDVEYLSSYESNGLFDQYLAGNWLGRHCFYVLVGSFLVRNALLLLGV